MILLASLNLGIINYILYTITQAKTCWMNEFKLHQLRERRLVDFPKFQVIEG